MAGNRISLTKAAIDGFPPAGEGKRAYYYDTRAKGLVLAVTDRGTKSFMVYRWVSGRPERITLGRYAQGTGPGLTIEQARKAAADANLSIAKGENPAEKKRAARGEITLGGMFEEYCARHIDVHSRRPDKPKANFRLYLSHWSNRKLSQVRKPDIQALHAKLGREKGQVTANIAVKLLRSMFNRAIDWELYNKPNPARGIKFFEENSRERFLQPDELPRFFSALAQEPNETIRDFVLMALLTGGRRSNVQTMRWDEVSMERAEWRIDKNDKGKAKTKSGKPHVIPLLPEAIEILKRRALLRPDEGKQYEFVFHGAGEGGHLVEPKKGWRRILDRAELIQLVDWIAVVLGWQKEQAEIVKAAPDVGRALKEARVTAKTLKIDPTPARIKDLRIHDLRRTLGSWQASTGANLPVIGRTLQHKNVSTTAIYARLNLDPVREAMQKAATAMLAAGGLLPAAEVTDIKDAKRKVKIRKAAV